MDVVADICVVGLGVVGLSTVYQASKRHPNLKILGLEARSLMHDEGSSHGESRLTRQAYSEGVMYVPLALDAHREWDAFGKEIGREVLHRTGVLYISSDANDPVIRGALKSAKTYQLSGVETFDAGRELSTRFPGMKGRSGDFALFERGAGWLEADTIRSGLCQQAQARGADLRFNTAVSGWWKLCNGNIRLSTNKGFLEARAVVFSAGCWTQKLVQGLDLHPKRRIVHWFEVDPNHLDERKKGPGFLLQRDSLCLYGFPAVQEPDGERRWVVKAAIHYDPHLYLYQKLQADCDPDTVERQVKETDETEMLLKGLMVGIGKKLKSKVCLYNCSNDGHFVIDTHPYHRNVVIASGFSGHGFKFAITVGKICTDLALGQKPEFDISFFSATRKTVAKL